MTACKPQQFEVTLALSTHAAQRLAQRGVQSGAITAALAYGEEYRQPEGRVGYFIGRRALRRARKDGVDISAHINTAVIFAADSTVVTVIRTDSPKRIKNYG